MAVTHNDTATFSGSTLDPSELGTKDYWDRFYNRELDNYLEDQEDEGTVWFSENNAERAVSNQLNKLDQQGFLKRGEADQLSAGGDAASRFLDLGTGNGHMLFELLEEDDDGRTWHGEMIGVDYSEASIQLARRIASQRHNGDSMPLRFEQWDLLSDLPGEWLKAGFDVVLDKGTFDAISLMETEPNTIHPCQTYRNNVTSIIKPGFFLCLTSCNWTKDELISWLAPVDGELTFHCEAHYPTFRFGGKAGQSIVTIVFRRKNE